MGTLIIALILIFIVWPVIKIAWRIYRMQNQAKKMFSQMNPQAQADRPSQRKAGWSTPHSNKKKKIGRDVGEYVSFENISVSTADTDSSHNSTASDNTEDHPESRISDADWEEIH